ncbi:MAG: hypothetical protein HQL69_17075, partial [Magnetococcales bacterium]|nr:hypothetical protein [Magnetococcales bacterium]
MLLSPSRQLEDAMAEELTERQRYWLGHLRACEESGGSMKGYADDHGLAAQELYHW